MTNPSMVTLSPLRFSAECLTRAAQVEGQGGHLLIHFDLITLGAAGTGAVADFPHPTRRYAVGHKPQMCRHWTFPLPATARFFYKQ